jgi:hypothetical protein
MGRGSHPAGRWLVKIGGTGGRQTWGPYPMTDRFQLAILRGDFGDLGLGYTYEGAFPKLEAGGTANALFVVGTNQIEAYHWSAQSITLTPEGTRDLLAALEPPEQLKESVRALNGMRAKLGWGDRLDHALYTKGFLVMLDGNALYGGIFLDATSQMAIRYPVIRASLAPDGKAQFNLMPVHIAFYTKDPLVCADEGDLAVAREMINDWRQFPDVLKTRIAGAATSDLATTLRALLRSHAVRVVMEGAGKLQ